MHTHTQRTRRQNVGPTGPLKVSCKVHHPEVAYKPFVVKEVSSVGSVSAAYLPTLLLLDGTLARATCPGYPFSGRFMQPFGSPSFSR